jgi:hypothetical protein
MIYQTVSHSDNTDVHTKEERKQSFFHKYKSLAKILWLEADGYIFYKGYLREGNMFQ